MAGCSRCKQQHWPLHKRKGHVLCEPCLAEITGGFGGFFSGMGRFYRKIKDFATKIIDRIRGTKRGTLKESRKPQRPSNKFAHVKPSKVVRIGGGYQKVK